MKNCSLNIELHQKIGQKEIFTIFVNEDDWRDIHRSIFGSSPKIPKSSSFSELEEWFQKTELQGAKKFSLRRLSIKSHPSIELRLALQKVLVSDATITSIIQECETLGYLNDQDWINRFIQRQYERKMGPRLIAAKLRAKGIKEEQITAALRSNELLGRENSQILKFLEQKYGKKDLTDFRTRRLVFAALMRRGFHSQEILEILENYTSAINSNSD